MPKTLAIFDFDGTISKKDSFLEFIKFTHGSLRLHTGLFYNINYVVKYFFNQYPNDKLKERLFSFFYKGMPEKELVEKGKLFSQKINSFCFPEALSLIEWHKNQQHEVYIITASSAIWLKHWCNLNSVKLIATKFEVINNKYTGNIVGENCYGKEKEKHVLRLLSGDYVITYGYGNDSSDKYFLDLLDNSYLMPLSKKNVKKIVER